MQNYKFPIIESHVFPCIQYFVLLNENKGLTIQAFEHYQKRSLRNRFFIGSKQGPIELSIPLCKGKNNHCLISETKISNTHNWKNKHWNTLKTIYGKSPYFIYYKDEIEHLLFDNYDSLLDLNMTIIQAIIKMLKINCSIDKTTEYTKEFESTTYQSITLSNRQSFQNKNYYQVYNVAGNFLNNLSILDCIFHLGPETTLYLKNISVKRSKIF